MPSTTYTIHEGPGITVEAEVEYDTHPASGGDRWEPFSPAYVEVCSAKLIKVTRKPKRDDNGQFVWIYARENLGPAPQWVLEILDADTDWQAELLADEREYEREYD